MLTFENYEYNMMESVANLFEKIVTSDAAEALSDKTLEAMEETISNLSYIIGAVDTYIDDENGKWDAPIEEYAGMRAEEVAKVEEQKKKDKKEELIRGLLEYIKEFN